VRQLCLRLVGEGTDIPRSCTNITVSIHAIAAFQALHDYLCPPVSSQGLPPNSRIVGKLAPFATVVGLPPGVLQGTSNPTTGQPTGGSTVKDAPSNTPLGATAVDSSGEAKQTAAGPSTFESDKGPHRSRLSAKSGARGTPSLPQHSVPEAKTPSTSSSQAQAKVETIEPMDMDDSFMDADVDPEVTHICGWW